MTATLSGQLAGARRRDYLGDIIIRLSRDRNVENPKYDRLFGQGYYACIPRRQ